MKTNILTSIVLGALLSISFILPAQADEKLVIYIQNDKPTDPKQLKNWLPAPDGDFRFAARFYGP